MKAAQQYIFSKKISTITVITICITAHCILWRLKSV